ncbi:MAG TPA: hypothetical protein VMZ51_08040 [Acidimicrobiales bacterium]|nr:hypothetical protein [Acidimicrobiales bacterium]
MIDALLAEAVLLLDVLDRANEGPVSDDQVMELSLLQRRLAGAVVYVETTDAHWVKVTQLARSWAA